MNQDVFFKNFELLADAPNGVQKLRELILQLAVMGKLVPQDPNDEPASLLFEKILIEKMKLLEEKKITKSNIVREVESDEVPFDLPKSWEWHRLEEIFYPISVSQNKVKSTEITETGKFPVVDQGQSYIAGYIDNAEKLINLPGPVIVFGDHTRILKYIDFDFVAGADGVKILRPIGMHERFFYLVLKSIKLEDRGYGRHYRILTNNLFALAPLEEQKRIVSKVDEFMALCDKLEVRRQKKQDLQSKLNSAALERMLIAENQEEFEQYWQRICENFDLLYDNLENVEKLRQAILQLAVQGKLVPQNPEDEPANVLIEKIEAEKRQLDKEGKIQKTKKLQSVDIEEIPYCVPDGWMWTRFGNIAPYIEAGWSPMCEKRPKEGDEWGILKISAVSWNTFNPSENKALPSNLKPRPEYEVKLNDFLMSRANTSGLVGKSVIVEKIIPKLMICDKVLRLFFSSFVSKKFYNIFNNSQTARFYYAKEASGTSSSMKNISREVIYNMPVPLPPLAEQKRIVEKVEQLMGLCDELESKLRKSRKDSEKLMEAVVKGLLEGAAAEKRELEKPIPLQVASIQLK